MQKADLTEVPAAMTLTPLESTRHRTLEDFRALLGRTGFRLTRAIETAAAVSILESEPV